ncbi:MAG: hypothetical protein V1779_05380 [bacterium]
MKKSVLLTLSFLVIIFFVFSPINSYSQFGGFGKKLKGALESTEDKGCDASKNLEQRMKVLRENAADLDRNGPLIPSSVENAKSAVKAVKNKCPHISTEKEEKEIAEIGEKYEKFVADKDAKDNEGKFLGKVFDLFRGFQGHFSSSPGLYGNLNIAQGFNKDCKDLDYINNQKKVDEFATKFPDIKVKGSKYYFQYNYIANEFHNNFKNAIDNYFVKEIDNAIEMSYASKAEGKEKMSRAKDQAECGVLISEGILLAFPDHPKVKELYGVAKDAYDKLMTEFEGTIFTSPVHKQYAGKIMFSNMPIVIKQEANSPFKNEFKGGEDIYGMVYLDGTLFDKTRATMWFDVKIIVDGNEKVKHKLKLSKDLQLNSYYLLEIAPNPKFCETEESVVFTKAFTEMSPRKHTIEVTCEESGVFAKGEFTLDGSTGMELYTQKLKDVEQSSVNRVRMIEPMMTDKKLEKEILEAIKRANWKEKVLRIVIGHPDWQYERNDYDIILNRFMHAAVATKNLDGTCSINNIYFYQKKIGNSWEKMEIEFIDSQLINCDNVNK